MKAKKYVLLPVISVLLGLAASALRAYERITGFDPVTQLMANGHLPSYVMMGFTALCVAFFFVMSRFDRALGGDRYTQVFGFECKYHLFFSVAAALVLLLSAVWQLRVYLTEAKMLYLVMALFTGFAVVCLLVTISARYMRKGSENIRLFTVVPVFWACYTLIVFFSEVSADPVVLDYIYDLLSYIFVLLSFYSLAAFAFGRENPKMCVFFLLSATFFATFAVGGPLVYAFFTQGVSMLDAVLGRLAFVFAAVYMPMMAGLLIKNMKRLDMAETDSKYF